MQKTIWKYILKDSKNLVNMPKGAKILTAKEQFEEICIWAEVDAQCEMEGRSFEVVGTGHNFTGGKYIGTASLQNGGLIFHIFEIEQIKR